MLLECHDDDDDKQKVINKEHVQGDHKKIPRDLFENRKYKKQKKKVVGNRNQCL